MSTPRQRYREQVRSEIKRAALAQVGSGGAAALSLNAVARQLGMTGPAIYKYFDGRDDLLTELILDGYGEAAAAVRAGVSEGAPRERLHALAGALVGWALAHPHLFELVTGTPSPGYRAPPESVRRGREVLGPFLPVFGLGRCGPAAEPLREQVRRWVEETPEVAAWVRAHAPGADAATALTGTILAWSRLQGILALEVHGRFVNVGPALVTAEMDTLADAMNL
ncbi:regulatory protein, tetR family [Nonomuraea solani]|uniref:Regulatory protein, tetR family n=1 Tax=Nonomuraea solani TaxID=1144553 RepID=A0A1H6BHQ4_9ACTN|nr:TetR/AcrR family transcriptional regulator [Nonomuraea solani]SEG59925.1 regulatory protein, tetR family [Nonomuraea solani]